MEPESIKAVLFDFDGVLFQTEVYRMDYREAQLAGYGIQVDRRALYALINQPPRYPHQPRGKYLDDLLGDQEAYRVNRDEILSYPQLSYNYPKLLTPGLAETVSQLHRAGFLLGVASNSSGTVLEEGLSSCGLAQYMDEVVSGWDLNRRKPDPYIYRLLMERLKVAPEQCVVVEDSQNGIRAGRAVGAAAVFALRDRDGLLDQEGCDKVLHHITELLSELRI